jgi:AcrR family transcriptional regulator
MASADHSGNLATSPPRLRRDAQRNRDAIVGAARQVFCDQGLEAPLEEIARRAGVGIGTLYRRFPSRTELLDAVLADALQAHIDLAERALAMEDPWEGFCFYLEETCRLQATDRGLNDAMGMRFPAPRPWRRPGGACLTWSAS